jgi:DNA-binding NarL/FixJ family response regulator
MKLLIIDDHAGLRGLIRLLLGKDSASVLECASGQEALELSVSFRPDFATVDISMPAMDGFATVKALLKLQPKLRCIIVSTYDSKELRAEAMRLGCVGYVAKNHLSELLPLLGQAC